VTLSLDEWFPEFSRNVVPSYSGSSSPKEWPVGRENGNTHVGIVIPVVDGWEG